jgi:hypothetical protein
MSHLQPHHSSGFRIASEQCTILTLPYLHTCYCASHQKASQTLLGSLSIGKTRHFPFHRSFPEYDEKPFELYKHLGAGLGVDGTESQAWVALGPDALKYAQP